MCASGKADRYPWRNIRCCSLLYGTGSPVCSATKSAAHNWLSCSRSCALNASKLAWTTLIFSCSDIVAFLLSSPPSGNNSSGETYLPDPGAGRTLRGSHQAQQIGLLPDLRELLFGQVVDAD